MKTRLLLLTLLALTTARAAAQTAAPPPTPVPATKSEAAAPPAVAPPATYGTWDPVGPPPRPLTAYRLAPPRLAPVPPRRHGKAGGPFALGVGGSMLWRTDRAYRVVAAVKRAGALELQASYDVWTPFRNTIVAAGLSVRFEEHGDDGALDLMLSHATVQADLLARYGALPWLWPHVWLALGLVTTRADAHDELARVRLRGRDNGLAGTLGAGFTLRTPTRLFETRGGRLASLSLGVLFEGGYTLAQAADLTLAPTGSSDVRRARTALGTIERSAPYVRIAAVVRF